MQPRAGKTEEAGSAAQQQRRWLVGRGRWRRRVPVEREGGLRATQTAAAMRRVVVEEDMAVVVWLAVASSMAVVEAQA